MHSKNADTIQPLVRNLKSFTDEILLKTSFKEPTSNYFCLQTDQFRTSYKYMLGGKNTDRVGYALTEADLHSLKELKQCVTYVCPMRANKLVEIVNGRLEGARGASSKLSQNKYHWTRN